MFRRETRLRMLENEVELIDPSLEDLPFLQALDPAFQVQMEPLEEFDGHRLVKTRRADTGLSNDALSRFADTDLWAVHRAALRRVCRGAPTRPSTPEVSLMDLKVELARRALGACGLCAHRCGVNRLVGELGICGLGSAAFVGEHFLHIAEEPPINPAYTFNLQGCGLRCRYCQQYKLLAVNPRRGRTLTPDVWEEIDLASARSLSFVGGNPDESAYAVLRFLQAAPEGFSLPIVWNCHGFAEPVLLRLLAGIVDVYVPDFKYGNDICGKTWSGVDGYFRIARRTIRNMVAQKATVFVRMLVLPGHLECCHRPALRWLARYRDRLRLRVMGQYTPDYLITPSDGSMSVRPMPEQIELVASEARQLGFRFV